MRNRRARSRKAASPRSKFGPIFEDVFHSQEVFINRCRYGITAKLTPSHLIPFTEMVYEVKAFTSDSYINVHSGSESSAAIKYNVELKTA